MSDRPLLVDAFCGAGGAGVGYSRAGFDVVGIDNRRQRANPFPIYYADALDALREIVEGRATWLPRPPVAIHASPPCQAYSDLKHRTGRDYPDLVGPVRDLLVASGLPYVIENVEGAPLVEPITLCGTMFPGLRVLRHRLFEANFPLTAPPHPAGPHPRVFTTDKRKSHYGKLDQDQAFVSVTGGGNCSTANARAAMGIPWMNKAELNEAIPPAYTQHVGYQLMAHLTIAAGA